MKTLALLRDKAASAASSLNPNTRAARRAYFAAGDRAWKTRDRLDGPMGRYPKSRASLITALSVCETQMADHVQGCHWDTAEDMEQAAVHETTATLLHLLASTEAAPGTYARIATPQEWEDAFGTVVDNLTDETDLTRRAELMTRLYIDAHPVVGVHVAETIEMLRGIYTRLALAAAAKASEQKQTYSQT